MRPLQGVHEHKAYQDDSGESPVMRCRECGNELESLRFGIWLIWITLENGQVCPGAALAVVDVQVCGYVTKVTIEPGWTIGAIATKARWQAGYGYIPFDEWEIRDGEGVLLDYTAPPGKVTLFFVERKAGVGG